MIATGRLQAGRSGARAILFVVTTPRITTEAMVAETPKKKEAPAMPGGGGMGGMDY